MLSLYVQVHYIITFKLSSAIKYQMTCAISHGKNHRNMSVAQKNFANSKALKLFFKKETW